MIINFMINRYYKTKRKTVPYCYIIKHKQSGLLYFGSRSCNGADPEKFFKDYFTSSKLVRQMISSEGIDAFSFRIVKIFDISSDCIEWERRFLKKVNAQSNPKFLNMDNNQMIHLVPQLKFETILISNGKTCIRWAKCKEIPFGWYRGNVNRGVDANIKKRKWWHNQDTGHVVHSSECPEGYISGRGSYCSNSKTLKNKNLHWCTNGESTKLMSIDEVPRGWYLGRVYKTKPKINRDARYIYG